MLLICEGIFFFGGLFALLTGRIRLWGNKTVRGERARLIGIILMIPGPLALMLGVIIGFNARTMDEVTRNLGTISIIELVGVLTCFIIAAYLYSTAPDDSLTETAPLVSIPTSSVLTVAEAAGYLRVSESDVLAMIEEGRLPAARIGGEYRIARSAIDDALRPS